ncbi:MAG: thioredoxin family protein, partial [Pirellulales bacterium]
MEANPKAGPWIAGLAEGRRRALAEGEPILVRATADWCPHCRILTEETDKAEARSALAEWTLVEVDVDRSPDEARRLEVTAIPALKILTARGQPVAEHVGTLEAAELVAWLEEHRQAARAAAEDALFATGKPKVMAVIKLSAAFDDRDPAVRRAA